MIQRITPYADGDDLPASRSFYVEVLGLEVAMEEPVLGLRSPANHTAQVLVPPRGMERPPPRFGVDVGDPAAVDAAHDEALRRGLRVVYPLTDEPWGIRRFFLEDPSGTVVNVLAHLPEQTSEPTRVVRRAGRSDAEVVGRLLHDFNREFGEPTPEPAALAQRVRDLLDVGDTLVLLAGTGPDGMAVLRFRLSIWSEGLECYLAELYVIPEERGHGLGRALMLAALDAARARGADSMDIGVDEPDTAARQLYESLGFSNREGGDGPLMYVYEREL